MTNPPPTTPWVLGSPVDQVFPTLTAAQIARVKAHGRLRRVEQGEVILDADDQNASFFVVVTGHVEVVRWSGDVEELVVAYGPGHFTGEMSMLTGRRALAR